MTIEAILQSIDSKLDVLIGLSGRDAAASGEPAILGAGADPAVAKQVETVLAAAGIQTEVSPSAKRGRGRPAKQAETVVAAPTAAPAAQPDPFAIGDAAPVIEAKARTLTEVRAALVVHQALNTQQAALKLMKDITGAETLAQLKEQDYSKLFKAAIPADRLDISDVRVVLVKLNERKAGEGMKVLERFGAADINKLTEDKFADAILAAHGIR